MEEVYIEGGIWRCIDLDAHSARRIRVSSESSQRLSPATLGVFICLSSYLGLTEVWNFSCNSIPSVLPHWMGSSDVSKKSLKQSVVQEPRREDVSPQ